MATRLAGKEAVHTEELTFFLPYQILYPTEVAIFRDSSSSALFGLAIDHRGTKARFGRHFPTM